MGQQPFYAVDGKGNRVMGSVNTRPGETCRHREVEPDATYDCSSGCCDGYRCKACGKGFRVEVPE